MFSVKFKNGELMDFDGQCTKVEYSDPRYTVFLNEADGKRLNLALIPTENILAIINSPEIQEPQKTFITEHDRIVISAYTGYLMCDFDKVHKFVEETLGRPVFTHELADDQLIQEIHEKLKSEWLRVIGPDLTKKNISGETELENN